MCDGDGEVRYAEPVLCYIDRRGGTWAWFTTRQLDKQWGDDWDDVPWEQNAGEPYEWGDDDGELGIEHWEVVRVAFHVDGMVLPGGHMLNSPYSVRDINTGVVGWLSPYYSSAKPILGGTPLSEFKRLIRANGGAVYVLEESGHERGGFADGVCVERSV